MRKWADKAAKIIVNQYDPDKIILFGSFAKDTGDLNSDIDLLIIKDTDIPRCYRGVEVLNMLSKYPIKFDLLFYTNSELVDGLAKKYSFIHSIFQTGIFLYEKP